MKNTRWGRSSGFGVVWLLLAPALIVTVGVAQPANAADVPPNPLEKPGWILDRHDEFNGSLDSSLWITNYLESRTPEWRSGARYHFSNDALVLRIDDDQPTYYADNPMKVSSIQTGQMTGLHKPDDPFDHSIPTIWNYTPQYGYFEIRAKSSGRHGVHTAFWTVGRQDTSTQRGEIDIVEHAPGTHGLNSFYYSLHRWSDPNLPETQQTIPVNFDVSTEFHIYALEWTPTQIRLYVDNVLTNTINASPGYPSVFLLSIYENAGWNGTVNPNDPEPKELVVDYFRAYKRDDTGGIVSGATYKIRNVATGGYLDSEGSGSLTLTSASSYDDQDWVVTQQSNGAWTIHNARAGRYYLDTEPSNVVIWNDGYVGADSQWRLESASGGFRLDNERSDRSYLYGTSAGQVRWNTGSTDSSTVWAFERQ
jgi:hypothetical protein